MAITINGSGSITGITTRLADAAAPAGSVIQVLQDVKSDQFTTDSNSPADVTGWSQAITTTGSNKVLVQVSCGMVSMLTGGQGAEIFLVRGSTILALGDTDASRTRVSASINGASTYDVYSVSITYLDSPGAGSHTYKVQMATQDSGTACINRRGDDTTDSTNNQVSASTLTLMEIAV